jgi:hypothetical protein
VAVDVVGQELQGIVEVPAVHEGAADVDSDEQRLPRRVGLHAVCGVAAAQHGNAEQEHDRNHDCK